MGGGPLQPETILLMLLLLLAAAAVGLLIAVLVRLRHDPARGFAQKLDDEFERSRREARQAEQQQREELDRELDQMRGQLEALRLETARNQTELTHRVADSLNQIRIQNLEQANRQSQAQAQALESLRRSNEEKLEQMRQTVEEKLTETLSQRLDSSFRTVSDRLESVNKSLGEMKELSGGVTANVTALNRVLTNVKARGTWAEVQLASILDQTLPGQYETNFAPDPASKERVEFAVRIPTGEGGSIAYLPIDSKFPMEDYVRLCAAADRADAEGLAAARKALELRVLAEAKAVSKYIQVPRTTPFAILYLATEGLYAEIAASRTGIAEKIQRVYGVMLAGPSTVTALLNSLSMGLRAVAINEKANEVRTLLAAARAQYEKFGAQLAKARAKIDEAGRSLDEAGKRNEIIAKKLKNADALGAEDAAAVLGLNETES